MWNYVLCSLSNIISTCQDKVTKVYSSQFKYPHDVDCGVQRVCGTLVHMEMHSGVKLSTSNPQGPENKHRRDLNKQKARTDNKQSKQSKIRIMYQHIQINFGVFLFKLTLEAFYSVLKQDYHFGFIETPEVILSLHINSFSPEQNMCGSCLSCPSERCIRWLQRSKESDEKFRTQWLSAIGIQTPENWDVLSGEEVLSRITCFRCLYEKPFLGTYIHSKKCSMIRSVCKIHLCKNHKLWKN